MSELLTLHDKAMDLAYMGDKALKQGDKDQAHDFYHQAYEIEKDVAWKAEEMKNPEPGLSILFRSASTLALQCGELREAERLAAHALSGNPSEETTEELREIIQEVYASARQANMADDAEVTYELHIPKSETSLFDTIMKRMGWAHSLFHSTKKKIAVL